MPDKNDLITDRKIVSQKQAERTPAANIKGAGARI
jgi:hypothetical protein